MTIDERVNITQENVLALYNKIDDAKKTIKRMNKGLKKQNKFNRRVLFISLVGISYGALYAFERLIIAKRLVSLENKVEELKKTKGV